MTCKRPTHIAFMIAFLAGIPCAWTADSAEFVAVPRISIEQAKQMIGGPDVVFIDVRRAKQWWRSSQKIAHAVRGEPGSLEKWAQKYGADKTLIFYCT